MFISSLLLLCGCENQTQTDERPVVAIAWHNNQNSYSFVSTIKTVEAAGGRPVILDMVRSDDLEYDEKGNLVWGKDENDMLTSEAADIIKKYSYKHSNVEEVMKDVKCLILPGGSDMSPSLYYKEEKPHGIKEETDYNAQRDVSDYLLTAYCLDKDIPLLCICRGMQVLSIVSKAQMIQDLDTWYASKDIDYNHIHRDPDKKIFYYHDIEITDKDSLLYKIYQNDVVKNVPSWHHQAVFNVDNTALSVTAYCNDQGVDLIEAVERKDKNFVVGVQFHPEVAVRKILDKEEDSDICMDYDQGLKLFKALIAVAYN